MSPSTLVLVDRLFEHARGLLAPHNFRRFSAQIWRLGLALVTQHAPSISMGMLTPPKARPTLIKAAQEQIRKVEREYTDGLITFAERRNKIVDIWAQCIEAVRFAINKEGHPLNDWLESGASHVERMKLGGVYGLLRTPKNAIEERPITRGFIDGLLTHDYFMHAMQHRRTWVEADFSKKQEHALTRRLWGRASRCEDRWAQLRHQKFRIPWAALHFAFWWRELLGP